MRITAAGTVNRFFSAVRHFTYMVYGGVFARQPGLKVVAGEVKLLSQQVTNATGRIAEIYGEIRHFYGVPYVSSLQRHLATLPGVLAVTTTRVLFAHDSAKTAVAHEFPVDAIQSVEGVQYGAFIVPGLIMLSLFTQSIFNASFGIYMPKWSGTIYEVLSAPVSATDSAR